MNSGAHRATLKFWLPLAAFFLVGIAVGSYFRPLPFHGSSSACQLQPIRSGGYDLINPLLICEVAGQQEFPEFSPLKATITDFVAAHTDSQTKVSVYFRAYGAGKWITINENEMYIPASLLKVPLMVAFYKLAETNPQLLSEKIQYKGDFDFDDMQKYQPEKKLVKGKFYTVEDLIYRMIVYSDNNSANLLGNRMDNQSLREIYSELGVQFPRDLPDNTPPLMSVKSYSLFFRILYNATYLSREMSEKALDLLTKADFPGGIEGSVPSDIKIAHKFGEAAESTSVKELHDCGIVYYTGHPYLLCVMAKGPLNADLEQVIRGISKIIYDYMDRKYAYSI